MVRLPHPRSRAPRIGRRSIALRHSAVLLLTLAVISAPLGSPTSAADDTPAKKRQGNGVHVEENITYGRGGEIDLKLDLARPEAGVGPFPGLVFVHGGGWRGGNRQRYRREIENAARQGYVAVTVTYRLTQADDNGKARYPFPAAVHDVKAAVRWLRANAEKYNVDPQRIGAMGGSAGGHLSLMLGLTDKSDGLEGEGGNAETSSRVQAVVNYFGPTEMTALSETSPGAAPIVASFLGGTPKEKVDVYRAASPITYVSKDDPPVLTLHGEVDKLVPPDQAHRLDEAMKQAGVPHETMILKGQAHGFRGPAGQQAIEAAYRFFDKHLKTEAADR